MLTVTRKNGIREIWHIGDDCRVISAYSADVASVEANEEELDYIIQNMVNIPYHKTKVTQKWVGPFARFIVMNLSNE